MFKKQAYIDLRAECKIFSVTWNIQNFFFYHCSFCLPVGGFHNWLFVIQRKLKGPLLQSFLKKSIFKWQHLTSLFNLRTTYQSQILFYFIALSSGATHSRESLQNKLDFRRVWPSVASCLSTVSPFHQLYLWKFLGCSYMFRSSIVSITPLENCSKAKEPVKVIWSLRVK